MKRTCVTFVLALLVDRSTVQHRDFPDESHFDQVSSTIISGARMRSFSIFLLTLITALGVLVSNTGRGVAQANAAVHVQREQTHAVLQMGQEVHRGDEDKQAGAVARRFYEQHIVRRGTSIHMEDGGDPPVPDAIRERFFTGAAAGDYFGFSVSSARDVNGDGYSEWRVRAGGAE